MGERKKWSFSLSMGFTQNHHFFFFPSFMTTCFSLYIFFSMSEQEVQLDVKNHITSSWSKNTGGGVCIRWYGGRQHIYGWGLLCSLRRTFSPISILMLASSLRTSWLTDHSQWFLNVCVWAHADYFYSLILFLFPFFNWRHQTYGISSLVA